MEFLVQPSIEVNSVGCTWKNWSGCEYLCITWCPTKVEYCSPTGVGFSPMDNGNMK